MRQILISACSMCLMLLTAGCATTAHFTKLPKPEDFKQPIAELKAEYPDLMISEWDMGTVFDMPKASELKNAWGEPHDTGFTYWMLSPGVCLFQPSNYWYWEFEDKKVAALIGRPILLGYKRHVDSLEVMEKE
jgi:hypothetical protein